MARVDAFSERSSSTNQGFGSVLDVEAHDIRSATVSAGGQLSRSFSTSAAVLVPQFRFEFEYQFEDNKEGITGVFQTDPNDTPFTIQGNERDSSYINLGVGTSLVFPNGQSAFLFYESRAQQDDVTINYLKAGYRFDF